MEISMWDIPNPVLTIKNWYELRDYDDNYQRLKIPPRSLPKKLVIEDTDKIWLGSIEPILNRKSFDFVTEIEISQDNPYVKVIDNIIYSKDGKDLLYCLKSRNGQVIIPEGVETICASAFYKSNIGEVIFPDTLRLIESNAFMHCKSLNNICTKNVKTIGRNAFYNCCKLKNIEFGDAIRKINAEAFAHTIIESVVLPKKLKYVGQRAFANRHLREVTTMDPIEKVEEDAFLPVSKINTNVYDENLLHSSIEQKNMKPVDGSFLNNDDYTGHFLLINMSGKEIVVPKYMKRTNLYVAIWKIGDFMISHDVSKIISLYEYGETKFHQELAAIEILKRYDSEPAKEFLNKNAKDIAIEFPEEYVLSILKMDIFNIDALIQMLASVQARGYKIAAAYILEKINTCNKNDDERFKKFDC